MPERESVLKRYEILVVDDASDLLLTVEGILQKEGYSVTCKESGKEGLNAAKSGNFDLILLDIVMPEMDGFEVCRELKNDPKTKDIPVIFLTIKGEANYIKDGFELGAADYLIKPFDKYEILARVRPHAQLSRIKKTHPDII